MVSNAFFRSTNTPIAIPLLSIQFVISSISCISASDVDLYVLNPFWLSVRRLCFSMNLSSLSENSFSSILENWGSKETEVFCEMVSISGFKQWYHFCHFHFVWNCTWLKREITDVDEWFHNSLNNCLYCWHVNIIPVCRSFVLTFSYNLHNFFIITCTLKNCFIKLSTANGLLQLKGQLT